MSTHIAPEPTDVVRPTRIALETDDGGGVRWTLLDQGDSIAPRPLWTSQGSARVALVGISMMLLGGDDVRIRVQVGEGARLEVVEIAALIAHRAEGAWASWSMDVSVGRNATFLYDGAPLIAATGSAVRRDMTIRLAEGSHALLRETLVLGRDGERGGVIDSTMRIDGVDGPILVDRVRLGDRAARLPGLAGAHRVVDSVLAVGWRPIVELEDRALTPLRLESPGLLVRGLASRTEPISSRCDALYRSLRDAGCL